MTKDQEKGKNIKAWAGFGLGLALAGLGTYSVAKFIDSGKPKIKGHILLDGLNNEEVSILRDRNGFTHIKGDSMEDIFFAQGFAHGQDRLFQMDLIRRLSSGKLSEILGEKAIESDKFYLNLGLNRAAEDSIEKYNDKELRYLKSYRDGVNAYIEKAIEDKDLCVEFRLLSYEPELWTITDSLLVLKKMAYDMTTTWKNQIFRQYIMENFPEEEAIELFPELPEDKPVSIEDNELLMSIFSDDIQGNKDDDNINGSNNWVVSGEKTISGKPLLANDPHLAISTPSMWYGNKLETKDFLISGVTIPGVPGIIAGHNKDISWGITNTGPDVQDIYVEKINPKDPTQYRFKDEWLDMEIIPYNIKVKDGEDIEFLVRKTHHGPIISDTQRDIYSRIDQDEEFVDKVLSLKWTALEGSREMAALFNVCKSKDWDEFENSLKDFKAPTQNFVFASKDGDIGFKANGKIPIRPNSDGMLPVEGWSGENEWEEYIPFDKLPKLVNPKSGYIVTANYKIVGDDYPFSITNDWAEPYRHERIDELLKDREDLDIRDMIDIQGDIKNLRAAELIPMIKLILKDSKASKIGQTFEILDRWEEEGYRDDIDSIGALLFNKWIDNIISIILESEIPEEIYNLLYGRAKIVYQLLKSEIEGIPSKWLKRYGGCERVLIDALNITYKYIEKTQGKNIINWNYGNYHRVEFKHELSKNKLLAGYFNRNKTKATPGSSITVRASGNNKDGIVNHGASWRFVSDLSDLERSYQIIAPGNSGHPRSPYYHDKIEMWIAGDLYEVDTNENLGDKLILIQNRYSG